MKKCSVFIIVKYYYDLLRNRTVECRRTNEGGSVIVWGTAPAQDNTNQFFP